MISRDAIDVVDLVDTWPDPKDQQSQMRQSAVNLLQPFDDVRPVVEAAMDQQDARSARSHDTDERLDLQEVVDGRERGRDQRRDQHGIGRIRERRGEGDDVVGADAQRRERVRATSNVRDELRECQLDRVVRGVAGRDEALRGRVAMLGRDPLEPLDQTSGFGGSDEHHFPPFGARGRMASEGAEFIGAIHSRDRGSAAGSRSDQRPRPAHPFIAPSLSRKPDPQARRSRASLQTRNPLASPRASSARNRHCATE